MGAFKYTVEQLVEAARLIIDSQFSSVGMVQRRLGVGTGVAEAILSRLHELGVVGPDRRGTDREILVRPARRPAAIACIIAGYRYDPTTPVAAGRDTIPWTAMTGAVGLAYSAMPDDMPDDQARAVAEKIVGLLADAGWRPLRSAL